MIKNNSMALALQALGFTTSPSNSAHTDRVQNRKSNERPKNGEIRHKDFQKKSQTKPKIKSKVGSRSKPVPVYRGPLLKAQKGNPKRHKSGHLSSKLRLELHSEVTLQKRATSHFGVLDYSSKFEESISFNSELDSIDLVIGLDFGTSSTKVVIRDKTLDRNYLVPFRDILGVDRYLLPSRVFLSSDGHYKLKEDGTGEWIRDLKLPLLCDEVHADSRAHAVGYLALVLKHVRSWLLSEFSSLYSKCNLLWTVHLGVPSESKIDKLQSEFFQSLIWSAWKCSMISSGVVFNTCNLQSAELLKVIPETEMDPEFQVFAELAAQVTGFCTSDQFDPDKSNYYLVIDVGAGTLDSCLLRIDRDEQKYFALTFFSFNVEHHGVINLHRTRLNWLIDLIDRIPVQREKVTKLLSELKAAQESADLDTEVPASFTDYLKPCTWEQSGEDKGPDADFMLRSVKRQVISDTLYLPVKNGIAPHGAAEDLPVFICGGGAMHPYYQSIFEHIQKQSGISWISTKKKHLTPPENLHAPTLEASQYHRMSVAFGLAIRPMMKERRSNRTYEGIFRLTSDFSESGLVTKDMV